MDSRDDTQARTDASTRSAEDRMRSTGQEALDAAKAQGQARLEQARDSTAASANRTAEALRQTADSLASQGDEGLARAVTVLSDKLAQLAGDLERRNVEELIRDATRLAREHPGMFIAGGVALGFALTRFFRASTPADRVATGTGSHAGVTARAPAPPAAARPGATIAGYADSTGTTGGSYE